MEQPPPVRGLACIVQGSPFCPTSHIPLPPPRPLPQDSTRETPRLVHSGSAASASFLPSDPVTQGNPKVRACVVPSGFQWTLTISTSRVALPTSSRGASPRNLLLRACSCWACGFSVSARICPRRPLRGPGAGGQSRSPTHPGAPPVPPPGGAAPPPRVPAHRGRAASRAPSCWTCSALNPQVHVRRYTPRTCTQRLLKEGVSVSSGNTRF